MNKLVESLKTLGYSNKEALTYVSLLELGRATAYSVSEKSGLKKPTTHVILGELLKKGAVITIPGAKKKIFTARSPEELFTRAEEGFARAKKSLPDLLSMALESRSEFKTLYYEGIQGLKDSLYYKMKTVKKKELIGFYALVTKDVDPVVLRMFDVWGKDLKENSIRMRGFTPEHSSTERYRPASNDPYRDLRFLPLENYSSEISIEALDDFVRITDIRHLQIVIIDKPHIARTLRQIFEMMWQVLPR